ncbi:P-loop containing nucleoside triphosphate hydrolase protein [Atractiella rhizophila]|nr:P-loop containing nucleoside triphosphate hydrolase protein [Atractiella rhizophila]
MTPLFTLAKKKGRLDVEDIYPLSATLRRMDATEDLAERRKLEERKGGRLRLWKILAEANTKDFVICLLVAIAHAVLGYAQPFFLNRILLQLTSPTGSRSVALQDAIWMLVLNLLKAQTYFHSLLSTRTTIIRIKRTLSKDVFEKSLRRPAVRGGEEEVKEKKWADAGKTINILSSDTETVVGMINVLVAMAGTPVELGIGVVFLYQLMGWSGFVGVIFLPISFLLTRVLAHFYSKLVKQGNEIKDLRMSRTEEMISNVRALKWFSWEAEFMSKVVAARNEEMHVLILKALVDVGLEFASNLTVPGMTVTGFWVFTMLAKRDLTIPIAFTALSIFQTLNGPLFNIAQGVMDMIGTWASVTRVEEFLNEDEIETDIVTTDGETMRLHRASFSYDSSAAERTFALKNLDVRFPDNGITLVTGVSGSGKTSLLLALLGEMELTDGKRHLPRCQGVSFASQDPFLMHATIRDNILFGEPFLEERYKAVIDACSLRQDLDELEGGDMTEIGERGISLSGGQKARVAFARSVYSKAGILLLDDILSAVDTHIAAQIVDSFSTALFENRSIVLVTHAVDQMLPKATLLLRMSEGHIILQKDVSQISTTSEVDAEVAGALLAEQSVDVKEERDFDDHHTGERKNGKVIEEETKREGAVTRGTYATYLCAAGWLSWTVAIFFYCLHRGSTRLALPPPEENVAPYLLIYFGIQLLTLCLKVFSRLIIKLATIKASKQLFRRCITSVARATFRYFDRTPTGRILNRFSSDFGTIDNTVPSWLHFWVWFTVEYFGSLLVVLYAVPSFLVVTGFLAISFIYLSKAYLSLSRDIRRIESLNNSPIFSLFGEVVHGLTTIRAYGQEGRFKALFSETVDRHLAAHSILRASNRWLMVRFDVTNAIGIFGSAALAIMGGVSPGMTALAISSSIVLQEASYWVVRGFGEIEIAFNSVERIEDLIDIPQEPPAIERIRPPAYWPSSSGGIIFENLSLSYSPDLAPALKNVNLEIKAGEKVGIVGRSGAGKTSLAYVLLRSMEPTGGKILIDGMDITTIGTRDLRSNITLIPQDPAVFSGTIRSNLDPFDEHSDEALWDVLRRVHLVTSSIPSGSPTPSMSPSPVEESKRLSIASLSHPVASGGSNLSAGQKQLLSLARAMLRRSKICILDEATAHVDHATDLAIQHAIRTEFIDSIVIAVAHRLDTVRDYDRIVVMDRGEVVEVGKPDDLLENKDGYFRALWDKR